MKAPSLDILNECFLLLLKMLLAKWFMCDVFYLLAENVIVLREFPSLYFISLPPTPTYTPNSAWHTIYSKDICY